MFACVAGNEVWLLEVLSLMLLNPVSVFVFVCVSDSLRIFFATLCFHISLLVFQDMKFVVLCLVISSFEFSITLSSFKCSPCVLLIP